MKKKFIAKNSYFIASILKLFFMFTQCEKFESFPNDFKWGIGTSSYQIEGSWNVDGKSESIWDFMTHNYPEKIADQSNGDQTAESYKYWKRDVEMVRELNVDFYRFSISWPRVLPNGYKNYINKPGIKYYNNLINELLAHNITPFVTIYHWDLPQRLQEMGGWTNPEMIDIFFDYAKVLFENFGDRIKMWTTFNEPWHICEQSLGQDYMAPAYDYPGIPSYLCGHNILKAHAKVYHEYKNKYQNGVIGITVDISSPHPLRHHNHHDLQAVERANQFYVGWWMHPIFSQHGNYPKIMIDRIDELSKKQGFSKSRLPKFSDDEIKMIHKTSDFFGINSYTSIKVTLNDDDKNPGNHSIPSFQHDMGTIESQDESWESSGSVWLKVHPSGMLHLLKWIKKEYQNPPVYITENGVSDKGGLNDRKRVSYFNSYLTQVLNAINDGCNVKGYVAWSLMDSYEWKAGFTEKFGLYHVDFESSNKTRTPKLSAKVYSNIVKTKKIDWSYLPIVQEKSSSKNLQVSKIIFISFSIALIKLSSI